MVIASLALMFLNIYSASNTRELMFQAKYASVQDKIQVVASSFETADTLSTETVDQVISEMFKGMGSMLPVAAVLLFGFTMGMGPSGLFLGFSFGLSAAAVMMILRIRRSIRRLYASGN